MPNSSEHDLDRGRVRDRLIVSSVSRRLAGRHALAELI